MNKEEKIGELYSFLGALIWGIFPILIVLSYKSLPSIVSLSFSTLISAIVFFVIVILRGKLHELKNPTLLRYMFFIVSFTSVLYYVFYFWGLTKTSAGNSSIIATFEILTSYIFFHLIRKEHFSFESKIGSVLMMLGVFIVFFNDLTNFNFGDLLVLFATFCSPVGNLYQQKATKISSVETIIFMRSILATPILFLIAFCFGQQFSFGQVMDSIWFLLLNGVIVLGLSKIFWIGSIKRISVTKANALSTISPLLTLFFAWLILKENPTIIQMTSLVPFFFGVLLLTDNLKFKYNDA